MKETIKRYIRVGTYYYKIIEIPLASKDKLVTLIKWKYEILIRDYSRTEVDSIPKLDGFCVVPNHLNYQQIINNTFYNKYLPLKFNPISGNCDTILNFIKHFFGSQYLLGIDFFQILYLYPQEKLPILSLVSRENRSGKSTFLNFMKLIFDSNMSILTNQDLNSNFNSDWSSKILIGIDESFINKKEESEKIKQLSTAKFFRHEAKGQDRYEIEFFAKFILCSNNEDNFVTIDALETRYWVRKVPELKTKDDQILEKLKAEIPAFLYFLKNRKLSTQKKSRMWFSPEQIKTDALVRLKKNNRGRMEREMLNMIEYIMDTEGIDVIKICPKDVIDWLKYSGFRSPTFTNVKHILKVNWSLEPENNSNSYTGYHFDYTGTILSTARKGRYYTITREFISNLND